MENNFFTQRIFSFKFALNGIRHLLKNETNFRIHLLASFIVLALAWITDISQTEWLLIIVCIGSVFGAEAFNSAIECICDFVCKEKNKNIKIIKDISAAAVLIISAMAAIIGIIIFCEKS
nr:diacylglycerol kinase family protein [uncultured Draconibacterium sp.]